MLNARMIKNNNNRLKQPKWRHEKPFNERRSKRKNDPALNSNYWIYGTHATLAALSNPKRVCLRTIATQKFLAAHAQKINFKSVEIVERREIVRVLPEGAIHQGIATFVNPLSITNLEQELEKINNKEKSSIVVLDQATDPRNIGAVLRSASGFGISFLLLQDRNTPSETGAMAKAASGALENTPIVRTANLTRGLAMLKSHGFWCIGLDSNVETPLQQMRLDGNIAFVYGAEGHGLRRLTSQNCDILAQIPLKGPIKTLNLANAVSISLYEWAR